MGGTPMLKLSPPFVEACRRQFPALSREIAGEPVAFFDGPAGTQVPSRVIDAIGKYLTDCNANHGGLFATSQESDDALWEVHGAVADLLGVDDPATISFGPNMTTLNFGLSRALSRTWRPGDEVLVTELDHDANITPWVLAARDVGATVKMVKIRKEDCTLDLDDFRAAITHRTRLVAVGCASNSVGTINPVREICQWSRAVGAITVLDAVHYAPHALLDVKNLGCDFLLCSAYKFFGPHIGIQWGRRELLEELPAYKLRPAPNQLPGKWMTGTQVHEGIAGVRGAIEYLADLGRELSRDGEMDRRRALTLAFQAIRQYESELTLHLLEGLRKLSSYRVWGISDPARIHERVSTVAVTHRDRSPAELAEYLGRRGIFAWHGNYYALSLSEALGREPEGMLRLGLVHYNTVHEVDRLLQLLKEMPTAD
jgi:cysteine desulfurase family protein (TIGR01976 family)